MADPITSGATDDDVLTAFLDGELGPEQRRAVEARIAADPALKARFEALAGSARPFAQAFAMVLGAAPGDRLQAALAKVAPQAGPVPPRRVWMSAAAVALFATGVAVGIVTRTPQPPATVAQLDLAPRAKSIAPASPPPPTAALVPAPAAPAAAPGQAAVEAQPSALASAQSVASPAQPTSAAPAATDAPAGAMGRVQPPPSWRQVVAEYLVLTTPATLSITPENPRLADAVAAYAGKLQIDMSADKLMLPMAVLKDVRLFDYRGRPLIEAAYLYDDAVALAFCIILNGQGDVPMSYEEREGENIVFWTTGSHGYMVAGKAPRERLEAIARDLAARFS